MLICKKLPLLYVLLFIEAIICYSCFVYFNNTTNFNIQFVLASKY